MSLTDDWKAGKLENGRYYIKTRVCEVSNVLGIPEYTTDYCTDGKFNYNYSIQEVLAPVPSYEELQLLKALAQNGSSAIDTNQRLTKKIESLRELLKECKVHLENAKPALWNFPETERLLTRINTAIGESEE